MKRFCFLGFLAVMLGVGCSKSVTITGENGEKVTMNSGTGDMTIQTKDGETVKVKQQGDSWSAKSTDGSEVRVEDGKVIGKNEKGDTFEGGIAAVSEADLGIPFYPGSKPMENGSAKLQTKDGVSYSVNRSTTDMPDKVMEFYKSKFKEPQMFNSNDEGTVHAQIGGKLPDGADVAIIALRQKGEPATQIMMTVNRTKAK